MPTPEATQMMARIRNGRRACVSHQRDFFARLQPLDQLRHAPVLIVLVVAHRRRMNLMAREQLPGPPRVLACDQIDRFKRPNGARGNVVRIPDRSRDHIQNAAALGLFICAGRHYNSNLLFADGVISVAAGKATLLISCIDRPGIIARVAGHLFTLGCNIITSDQYSDDEDGHFFWRIYFESLRLPIDELNGELDTSMMSLMLCSICAMRRAEKAGIRSLRSRACCSPSICVRNGKPMNLSYCS